MLNTHLSDGPNSQHSHTHHHGCECPCVCDHDESFYFYSAVGTVSILHLLGLFVYLGQIHFYDFTSRTQAQTNRGKPAIALHFHRPSESIQKPVVATPAESQTHFSQKPLEKPVDTQQSLYPTEQPASIASESQIEPTRYVKPIYPQVALRRGHQGIVALKLLVSKSGIIEMVKLEKSSGFRTLDQSAIAAVKQWVFPNDAFSIDTWINKTIEFRIQ